MENAKKRRGGPGKGQGRKPLGKKPSVVIQARVTEEQREKYRRIGGPAWVRRKIDEEKE